ncbi:NAD(P)-dependent oxidoreductase, partial [Candidatus Woesearchaeota archaeon]|nr:NAD(P)-dependent oxidoreductase [Candidatus Woesearchaeota archaeon]
LYTAIMLCMKHKKLNNALDITSSAPVYKLQILEFFSKQYGLKYKISKSLKHRSATGAKDCYYSVNLNAKKISYKPTRSSMDAIREESKYILGNISRK